jgi:hypothetical protein
MFRLPAYDQVGIAVLGFGILAVAALAFALLAARLSLLVGSSISPAFALMTQLLLYLPKSPR